ncbi:MAG: quinone-dependent dihydroorotate dehydrogenase [Chloroflexota bacterium]
MSSYEQLAFPSCANWMLRRPTTRPLRALILPSGLLPGGLFWRQIAGSLPVDPVVCAGLTFPNVLGLAAGFDKDARVVEGLSLLGFGHIEVGTLTPRPQAGNPPPRVFRLVEDQGLINRMGFPNAGVQAVVARLRRLTVHSRPYVLGVSLGKQKETPLAEAVDDYLAVMQVVYQYSDYLAVNISSPNTPGLRELQGQQYLEDLLAGLKQAGVELSAQNGLEPRPIFVKIAPDLTWPELDEILAAVESTGIDGIIATNTTLQRDGLTDHRRDESGGLSGAPLRERSTDIIAYIARHTSGRLPIIGVGGISTAADICEKLDAGATLVQLYTSLVYGGPGLPGRLVRELSNNPCEASS